MPQPQSARCARAHKIGRAAMQEAGHLTADEAATLAATPVAIVARSSDAAHYAVDFVLDQLPDFVGRPRADLDVITTLDGRLNWQPNKPSHRFCRPRRNPQAGQAAMVVMTPDGAIRAMVGGNLIKKPVQSRHPSTPSTGFGVQALCLFDGLGKRADPADIYGRAGEHRRMAEKL